MGVRELRFHHDTSGSHANHASAGVGRVSQSRRLRECVQVAAVCYRVDRKGVKFLLVQTRGSGRWTFPKGGVEPGLTHAHAAALEAFEEAGVHGRMEEVSFAQYVRRRRIGKKNSDTQTEAINAYLCEVLWLGQPEESGRNPSWFSPERAKRRLRESRSSDFAAELARIVDRAVVRIQRLRKSAGAATDALQKVRFEAFEGMDGHRWMQEASFSRYVRYARDDAQRPETIKLAVHARLSKVLQFVPPQEFNQNAALFPGDEAEPVRAVDASATRIPQLPSAAGTNDDRTLQKASIAELDHARETAVRTKIPGAKRKNRGSAMQNM